VYKETQQQMSKDYNKHATPTQLSSSI